MKVCDAASYPPPTPPWSEAGPEAQAGSRLIVALMRVCPAALVHTSDPEGVSHNTGARCWILARRGSPGRSRIFR